MLLWICLQAVGGSFSSTKSSTTSLKMLLAKETSKEVESKSNPPSVVARLMGLEDDFPAKEPVLYHAKRDFRKSQSCNHLTVTKKALQQQEQRNSIQSVTQVIHGSCETIEYDGVYEGCEEKARMSLFQDQSSQEGRHSESKSGRMDTVPEKFRQGKCLAMEEKLLHSELQASLQDLSSEKDFFLKCHEEPDPILPRWMSGLHRTPGSPQTRRITVLKPMRSVQYNGVRQSRTDQAIEPNGPGLRKFHQRSSSKEGIASQPSRIVLLRPTPGKPSIPNAKVTCKAAPFRLINRNNLNRILVDNGATPGCTEVVNDIIRHRQYDCPQRDDSLLSSTHSNGYGGDESSFSDSEGYLDHSGDSEVDYIEEDGGSFSDSEEGSPASKHSWDYTRRYGSHYSGSSFGRISHFPESMVTKEAKQRLSQRWAMVTCDDISQEQVQPPRSTRTLGEMLSLNEEPKEDFTSGKKDDKTGERSRKLPRSKSLPVISDTFDNMVSKVQASNPESCKPATEVLLSNKGKSSFTGRVSDFLFPKRKPIRQKSSHHPPDCFDERVEACFGDSQSHANHSLETDEKLALCEEKIDISAIQNSTSTSEVGVLSQTS